ncbi:MAG: PEP-CTERM/exosortase system-associated acyltransferase [Pseudomonadota bacterium]
MGQHQSTLAENFLRYFDVALAKTDAQKRDVYGIRYSVYCSEFKYEPAHLYPDHLETDEFDDASLHGLITHKATGIPAGCVRLVTPQMANGRETLPFERNCEEALDKEFVAGLNISRSTVCEISRLAVDGAFRRRPGEKTTRFGEVGGLDCTQQERRTFSMIAVACFLTATALIDLSGRSSVFAMMEPFLPRLLRRSGILFQRAGNDIDYHGVRAPYFVTHQSLMDNILPDLNQLYLEIHSRVEKDYSPSKGR